MKQRKLKKPSLKKVEIYTDGSWKRGIGAGGWSAMLIYWPHWKLITSSESPTTISRMELLAVINALENLTEPCEVKLVSDSSYVVGCVNDWIRQWKRHGWINHSGKPVANLDLIMRLHALLEIHRVRATWVKAHTDRTDKHSNANRIVDYFAQKSADDHHNLD